MITVQAIMIGLLYLVQKSFAFTTIASLLVSCTCFFSAIIIISIYKNLFVLINYERVVWVHVNIFQYFIIIRPWTSFGKLHRSCDDLIHSLIDRIQFFLRSDLIRVYRLQYLLYRVLAFVFIHFFFAAIFLRVTDRMAFVAIGFYLE